MSFLILPPAIVVNGHDGGNYNTLAVGVRHLQGEVLGCAAARGVLAYGNGSQKETDRPHG